MFVHMYKKHTYIRPLNLPDVLFCACALGLNGSNFTEKFTREFTALRKHGFVE